MERRAAGGGGPIGRNGSQTDQSKVQGTTGASHISQGDAAWAFALQDELLGRYRRAYAGGHAQAVPGAWRGFADPRGVGAAGARPTGDQSHGQERNLRRVGLWSG